MKKDKLEDYILIAIGIVISFVMWGLIVVGLINYFFTK